MQLLRFALMRILVLIGVTFIHMTIRRITLEMDKNMVLTFM